MLRTALGRARGLGSAKQGVGHFWAQRLTAVGLVPLFLWFTISMVALTGVDYAVFKAWVSKPFNTTMLTLMVTTSAYHGLIGIRTVIEDYVHAEWKKFAALILVKLGAGFFAALGVVSIFKVAFGG